MKGLLTTAACVLAAVSASAETPGVRNPFWPVDYEGRREAITAEVRVQPKTKADIERELAAKKAAEEQARLSAEEKAAQAAAEKARREAEAAKKAAEEAEKAKIITSEHWAKARAALNFGGRAKVRTEDGAEERSCVIINGNAYADGDLVSVNHGRNRFTWKVTGLMDGGKLKLVRVRARNLDEKPGRKTEDGKTGKGDKQ